MKQVLPLLLVLLLMTVSYQASSQNIKKLDEKYGFRDAAFESDFSSYSDMVLVEESPNNKYYKRTSDNLTVGENQLESIVYGFYKGKLSVIMIKTKGFTNSQGFLAVLTTQYGPGSKSNRYMEEYNWFGKRTILGYDENSATHDASIMMFSRPLSELEEKEKKEAAKKAASDI